MRTIIVTGVNGFIGKNLLLSIKKDNSYAKDRLILLSSKEVPGYDCIVSSSYEFTKKDFLDKAITQIDVFIHLGSFTPKSFSDANHLDSCTSNITNTLRLLNILPHVPKRFVYVSTLDVYASTEDYISELSPIEPVSLYGWSKLYTEKLIQVWAEQNSVIYAIARLGHIYGPGEEAYKKIIPSTIKLLKAGENPKIFTNGLERRAFLHVSDCCRLLISLSQIDKVIGPINIVSDQSITIKELMITLIELSGKDVVVEILQTMPAGRDMRFDNSKMRKYLPEPIVDFRTGLQEEIDAYDC